MARLAAVDLSTPDTTTSIYTIPADKLATVFINVCNRNSTSVAVSIALTKGSSPTDADWIEFQHPLDGFCSIQRTGEPLEAGDRIYVSASHANVSVVVTGAVEAPME